MESPVRRRLPGEGIGFQHIRRLTGWLSHSTDTWNDAQLAELADRMPHSLDGIFPVRHQPAEPLFEEKEGQNQ